MDAGGDERGIMRILIPGGDGMLGHQLLLHFRNRNAFEVRVTLRRHLSAYEQFGLFTGDNAFTEVDVRDINRVSGVIEDFRPHVVVNAVGIVKQRETAREVAPSLEINALFPHKLALICRKTGARLIHMSTDCVFTGRRGCYTEEDIPDAEDLYGRTKFLGELHDEGCVTLRTSIIGLELSGRKSLVEWFLGQRGTIRGYKRAIYTGLTTMEMARVIERVIMRHDKLNGVWQIASQPISKYELLCRLSEKLGRRDVLIEEDEQFACDRSLVSERFNQATGYRPPDWDRMLAELAELILQRGE
jgi:dTDP-4-dehydrorhamnose reductase